jgi:hypothetical protein
MNEPGSYPKSKMISGPGVIIGAFLINMESKRIMVIAEFRTITPAAHPYNNRERFLLALNQVRDLHESIPMRMIARM